MGWKVKLRKDRSIWRYFTENPQGGGFGCSTNSGAPRGAALLQATRGIPAGAKYELEVNGKPAGTFTKGATTR